MQVFEINNWAERESLETEWLALWHGQLEPLPFTHPIWARTWWRFFGAGRQLRLLVVEEDGQVLALAPLFVERSAPLPGRLRALGFGTTNDYNDWLMPRDPELRLACARGLFAHLAERSDWLKLEVPGLLPGAMLLSTVEEAERTGILVERRAGLSCPVATLDSDWDSYLTGRPRTLRYHLRSRPKRLAELGTVGLEHSTPETAQPLVEEAIRVHGLRWQGRNSDAIFSSSQQGRQFYRSVIPLMIDCGLAGVTSFTLDDRAVATVVGFTIADRYYYYVPAFDPGFEAYSPGKILVARIMERLLADGVRTFDFMLGDERYKDEWATGHRDLVHLTLTPNRRRARLLRSAEGAFRRVRRQAGRSTQLRRWRDRVRTLASRVFL